MRFRSRPTSAAVYSVNASAGLLLGVLFVCSGCSSYSLSSARSHFYRGNLQEATQHLTQSQLPRKDSLLYFMELGLVYQARHAYKKSNELFLRAAELLDELDKISVSKGTASWVVNDRVKNYKGAPYEQTLLHTFTAKNHLALGHWNNAAIEGKRILQSLTRSVARGYPDDPYSRYMAGFCLGLIDDHTNAALQFEKADDLTSDVSIQKNSGRLSSAQQHQEHVHQEPPSRKTTPGTETKFEFLCFINFGRSLGEETDWGEAPLVSEPIYAEIYSDDQLLGRSYQLTDSVSLAFDTEQKEATKKAAKTVGRVALKEAIAQAAEQEGGEALGEFLRVVLIGLLERPDERRWETLPRWLQIARVPCPAQLPYYDVVFKTPLGTTIGRRRVKTPITRFRNTYVSFCRDLFHRP